MPIGDFEREVLRTIAGNRHPDSFVGGATVLHQAPRSPRASQDIDLFHGAEESLAAASEQDAQTLTASGFVVDTDKSTATFRRAIVER